MAGYGAPPWGPLGLGMGPPLGVTRGWVWGPSWYGAPLSMGPLWGPLGAGYGAPLGATRAGYWAPLGATRAGYGAPLGIGPSLEATRPHGSTGISGLVVFPDTSTWKRSTLYTPSSHY